MSEETMRAGAITGERAGGVATVPMPRAGGDVALVKVHAAPLCTEFQGFKAGQVSSCLGHEAAGEVVEIRDGARVRVGDRVVVQPQYACGRCFLCQAGDHIHCENQRDVRQETGSETGTATIAQYLLKPDYLLTPIPDGMSYDHAAMACCALGPTFGAMNRLGVGADDTVLITGLGPVGLGGVVNARVRGARVLGVEGHPYRAALAKELGAEAVIDPADPDAAAREVRALTEGRGADWGIETSGRAEAKDFLVEATRRRGGIALIGWQGTLDANAILRKGLTVTGVWHYNLRDADRLLEIIARSGDALERLITHRFLLSRIQDAWETQVSGACGKVIVHPWE